MKLESTYSRDEFLQFLDENFLTDFKKDVRPASTQGLSSIQKAYSLGRSESLDLQVFEFSFEGSPNKRVTLTKDAFQVMRSSAIFRALAIFHSPNSDDWRLSLMTATPERTEKGKVALSYSNPKRLSFFLGPNAKVNTPTKFILKRNKVIDFEDLKSRFSIEVVNKEFYKEISGLFTQLVGGSITNGKKIENYEALLSLSDVQDHSQTSLEFAVRLIGRVIFCWFLREKKSNQSKSLMPHELLSLEAVKNNPDYYHNILEPIFFEVLNKPGMSRKDDFAKEPFSSIPYLNGGLFSPHDDDFFSYNGGKQAATRDLVIVPDNWLYKFFAVLETYNFTIDENTSFDEELSIDPEMLGRIFENLLAEINPETGESARKSTGSYYTPRAIVDYMIDESLLLYLKTQTQIDEGKLRAAISYDLNDDEGNQLTEHERELIISALEKVKILDPACGSGAFPIGALQKIVFVLQLVDPEGHMWFNKQIKNTPQEIKRVLQREFQNKNFDYIRKLGIIRENIYGVDIQPIATEISRLRCFLTLVVDQRNQENSDNRGIEPLPNLDFKFVTANTLIGLPGSQVNNQIGLFEDDAGISELKELRDMFFNATGAEREQLKLQFVQSQNRMLQRLNSVVRGGRAELTTKLSTWDPFSHASSSWFDPEWMFGIKEGFDIVIANPPYGAALSDTEKLYLEEKFAKHRSSTKNSAIYFVYTSKDLLKPRGILSFIVPKSLCYSSGWRKCAEFLIGGLRKLIDSGKAFELVKLEQVIFVHLRADHEPYYINGIYDGTNVQEFDEVEKSIFFTYQVLLAGQSPDELKLIKKIAQRFTYKLIGYVTIERGLNWQSKAKKNSGTTPIYRGAQLFPYALGKSTDYIDLTHFGRNEYDYQLRPKILNQLAIAHVQNPYPHFYLQATVDFEDKLVFETISCTFMKSSNIDMKFILALNNSRLFAWLLYKFIYSNAIRSTRYDEKYVGNIPCPDLEEVDQSVFINIVDKILKITDNEGYLKNNDEKIQVKELEKQIDQMVYKLYDLTEDEIRVVEGKTLGSGNAEPILKSTPPTELAEQFIIS